MRELPSVLKSESGSSLVEYAIVFILLMTMLLGIADFSRALYAYHFVSNAAREATRFASVRGANCVNTTPIVSACPAALSDVKTFVQNVPLGINKSAVDVTVPAGCTWPAANAVGNNACFTVTYTFNFLFPFVSKKTLTMSSTSISVIWN